MAMRPMRPCRHPGCGKLVREGYCPAHKPAKAERKASARWHDLYNLPLWKEELRPGQLLREPFCRSCARKGIRTRATVVDHIKPHRGDWTLFCDPGNLQSLCKGCHDRKTAREQWEERRGNRGK